LALFQREEPSSVLARRYQISEATLYRWRDDVLAGGKARLASSQAAKKQQADQVKQLEAERAERDMVIGELTIANRFLNKTSRLNSPTHIKKPSK
jgi:transposase-like protein